MKTGMDRLRGLAATAGAVGMGMIGGAATARAATTSLGVSINRTLAVTVSGESMTASYFVSNFSVSEASFFGTSSVSFSDAFDGVLELSVDGNSFSDADDVVDLTGDTLTADVMVDIIPGIDAQVEFTFISDRNSTSLGVVRALYTLTNTSAAEISTTALIEGNYGSDSSTTIQATSSGDLLADANDLWVYSSDQNLGDEPDSGGADPALTLTRYGTGASVVPTNDTALADGNDDFGHEYALTIAAGETQRILVFIEMSATNASAIDGAEDFETLAAASSANLLDGISSAAQGEIVNYDQSTSSSGGGKSSGSAMALPSLLGGIAALAGMRRRRANAKNA